MFFEQPSLTTIIRIRITWKLINTDIALKGPDGLLYEKTLSVFLENISSPAHKFLIAPVNRYSQTDFRSGIGLYPEVLLYSVKRNCAQLDWTVAKYYRILSRKYYRWKKIGPRRWGKGNGRLLESLCINWSELRICSKSYLFYKIRTII